MNLKDIHVNPDNPRIIKDERFKKLCKSIKEFPKMMTLRPIIIDNEGMILGGNMRFKALLELGYKEVPDEWIRRAEALTEDEKRRFIIEDNLPFGEWDWESLANNWDESELIEWGMDIPEFAFKKEVEEDDYEIPDEIETDIVLGDLFEIGQHRLLCGDSTDGDQVARLMNGEKADIGITDPPYGVNYEGGLNKKKRERLQGDESANLHYDSMVQYSLYAKSSAPIYLWFASTVGKPVYDSVDRMGYKIRAMIIWNKQKAHYGNFMAQYMQKHEPCLYCIKDSPKWYGANNEVTVWDVIQPSKNEHHPTQKPVELMSRAINNSSKIEDLVLDLFLGSGTTMVASHQLNRKCYGMEIDPKYCQVIIDRMKKLDPEIVIKKNGEVL